MLKGSWHGFFVFVFLCPLMFTYNVNKVFCTKKTNKYVEKLLLLTLIQTLSLKWPVLRGESFKGDIRCKINFYMMFEHTCVGSVWTHPSYHDKNTPSAFFFYSPQIISTIFLSNWCHTGRPLPHLLTNTGISTLTRSEWAVKSPPLFWLQSRSRQEWLLSDWGALLLDVIMNIAGVIYSQHLSRWRRRGLLLFLKGIPPPQCIYVCANHSWSSLTSRRSECKFFFFKNLCKLRFLIMC